MYVQEKEGVYPYGVTNPVNLRLPQEGDIHRSNELISVLKALKLYETAAGTIQRERVLNELNRIILEWVVEVGIEQGLDEEEARQAGGKIFTFGSYRLGVTTPGSDIDTLCVTPRHISREAFFSVLHAKLQQDARVSKLIPVPDAYTPLLKFNFDGVEIDLLFARLPLPLIPNSWSSLDNDLILRYVDEKTARSVNGSRVADLILKLVPNKETFRVTLRFIKYWAKSRCIYSNVLGYLGGISWSILVARCCQLYPNFSPSQLIQRFFTVYSIWNWRNSPVLLCKIKDQQGIDGLSNFKVWNPKVNIQVGREQTRRGRGRRKTRKRRDGNAWFFAVLNERSRFDKMSHQVGCMYTSHLTQAATTYRCLSTRVDAVRELVHLRCTYTSKDSPSWPCLPAYSPCMYCFACKFGCFQVYVHPFFLVACRCMQAWSMSGVRTPHLQYENVTRACKLGQFRVVYVHLVSGCI